MSSRKILFYYENTYSGFLVVRLLSQWGNLRFFHKLTELQLVKFNCCFTRHILYGCACSQSGARACYSVVAVFHTAWSAIKSQKNAWLMLTIQKSLKRRLINLQNNERNRNMSFADCWSSYSDSCHLVSCTVPFSYLC